MSDGDAEAARLTDDDVLGAEISCGSLVRYPIAEDYEDEQPFNWLFKQEDVAAAVDDVIRQLKRRVDDAREQDQMSKYNAYIKSIAIIKSNFAAVVDDDG